MYCIKVLEAIGIPHRPQVRDFVNPVISLGYRYEGSLLLNASASLPGQGRERPSNGHSGLYFSFMELQGASYYQAELAHT